MTSVAIDSNAVQPHPQAACGPNQSAKNPGSHSAGPQDHGRRPLHAMAMSDLNQTWRSMSAWILLIGLAMTLKAAGLEVASSAFPSLERPGSFPTPPRAASSDSRTPSHDIASAPDSATYSNPSEERLPFNERVTRALGDMGIWAPIGFIAFYVLLCVACVPGAPVTMAGGALFGVGWGFVYSWIAAQIGAAAAFMISRYVAHDWVARRLAKRPLLSAIEEAVAVEGWKIVSLLRLAPGSPFFLLNYLFGLTRVRFHDYVWATAVATIPGTFMFVYLGSLGRVAASGELNIREWVLHGLGLILNIAACVIVARRAKRVLRERLEAQKSEPGSPEAKPAGS
jgi:uncharacterized membrane protein YdjX (TVP38/TMEM64 family)